MKVNKPNPNWWAYKFYLQNYKVKNFEEFEKKLELDKKFENFIWENLKESIELE